MKPALSPDPRQHGVGGDFAFWGGELYLFVSGGAQQPTSVLRYRLSDARLLNLEQIEPEITGAGFRPARHCRQL